MSESDSYERRQEYVEELAEERARKRLHSCWCNLDGFPGTCPGPANCLYSGYEEKSK